MQIGRPICDHCAEFIEADNNEEMFSFEGRLWHPNCFVYTMLLKLKLYFTRFFTFNSCYLFQSFH